jgi:hypothetical protein
MDDAEARSHAEERAERSTDELRSDYAAWRQRLSDKAANNRAKATGADATSSTGPDTRAGYWDPDALFRDSERVAGEETTHLAVLDLRDDATAHQILTAYRNLAKLHHPDRWADADDDVRLYHENCMRNLNEAYHALKAQQRV